MSTAFMNLDLPTVSTTLGPAWATALNAAIGLIDSHDHTSGKGTQIPSSGLNINADLEFNNYRLTEVKSVKCEAQASTLTGASNANSIFSYGGNLYYTNGSGSAVQITSGGSLSSIAGDASSFSTTSITGNLVISPSDTFVYIFVDTSAARTITLPAAAAVTDGRVYIIKDNTGSARANNITIARSSTDTIDGATSYTIDSEFGSVMLVGDGTSLWGLS